MPTKSSQDQAQKEVDKQGISPELAAKIQRREDEKQARDAARKARNAKSADLRNNLQSIIADKKPQQETMLQYLSSMANKVGQLVSAIANKVSQFVSNVGVSGAATPSTPQVNVRSDSLRGNTPDTSTKGHEEVAKQSNTLQGLDSRGEKLAVINDKATQLADGAKVFATGARLLKEGMEEKRGIVKSGDKVAPQSTPATVSSKARSATKGRG
jgi:hypothetical protein